MINKWRRFGFLVGLLSLLFYAGCSKAYIRRASFDYFDPGERKKARQVIDKLASRVVKISSIQGRASGVILHKSGLVMTAYHPLVQYLTIGPSVTLNNGRVFSSQILLRNETHDFVLLKLEGEGPFPSVPIAKDYSRRDPVILMGQPPEEKEGAHSSGGKILMTRVNVPSALLNHEEREVIEGLYFRNVVVHTAPGFPGDSGGPLFDLQGHLVGINVASSGELEGITLAVPANFLKPYLDILAGFKNRIAFHQDLHRLTKKALRVKLSRAESKKLKALRKLLSFEKAQIPQNFGDQIEWLVESLVYNARQAVPKEEKWIEELGDKIQRQAREMKVEGKKEKEVLRWIWNEFWAQLREKKD